MFWAFGKAIASDQFSDLKPEIKETPLKSGSNSIPSNADV